MKEYTKRFVCLLLTLILAAGMLPMFALNSAGNSSYERSLQKGDVVWFGGENWIVLSTNAKYNMMWIETEAILLLSEHVLFESTYNAANYGSTYTSDEVWLTSDIRNHINTEYINSLHLTDTEKNALLPTFQKYTVHNGENGQGELCTVMTSDIFFIPTEEDMYNAGLFETTASWQYGRNNRLRDDAEVRRNWWLRTNDGHHAKFVSGTSEPYISQSGLDQTAGVRLAVYLNPNNVYKYESVMHSLVFTDSTYSTAGYEVVSIHGGNGWCSRAPASGNTGTRVVIESHAYDGYRFKQWRYSEGDAVIEDIYADPGVLIIGTSEVRVQPVFEPIPYTITYHGNGGAPGQDAVNTYNVESPDVTLPQATKTGDVFLGWYDNAGLRGSPVTTIPHGSMGNKEYWAAWQNRGRSEVDPTPINRTYNGELLTLFEAGEAANGTMVYSLSESGPFSPDVISAKDAGDYTVWYYVRGNAGYEDSPVANMRAAIARSEVRIETSYPDAGSKYIGEPLDDCQYDVKITGLFGDDSVDYWVSEVTGENYKQAIVHCEESQGNYKVTQKSGRIDGKYVSYKMPLDGMNTGDAAKVWFGKKLDGTPASWRITYGFKGGHTRCEMISDSLGDSIYSEQNIHGRYGSPYVDSVLKQTIDYAQSLLTPIERAAAGGASLIGTGAIAVPSYETVIEDRIFGPSVEETAYWPLVAKDVRGIDQSILLSSGRFWLASLGRDCFIATSANGGVDNSARNLYLSYAVRVGTSVDCDQILMYSAIEEKTDPVGIFTNSLQVSPSNSYKYTLYNGSASVGVRESSVSGIAGEVVTISYTNGARTADNEYISAIIEKDGKLLHYGKIKETETDISEGYAAFRIPTDIEAGKYVLRVFREQCSGPEESDYASAESLLYLNVTASPTGVGKALNTENAATVYFGQNANGDPLSWRVVGSDVFGVNAPTGRLMLVAAAAMGSSVFGSSNSYSTGALKNAIDAIANAISAAERAVIVPRTLESGSYSGASTDCISGDPVYNALLWPLSSREAHRIASELRVPIAGWLRSPGQTPSMVASIDRYGKVIDAGYYDGSSSYTVSKGVSPAMYIDLDSVLMYTQAVGGKTAAGSLQTMPENTTGAWKMTVIDATRTVEITTRSLDGVVFTVEWTGARTGANEYLSAFVKDEDGSILYYGKLKALTDASDASGTLTVDLSDIDMGNKTLCLFTEQCNGDYMTDYASAPVARTKDDRAHEIRYNENQEHGTVTADRTLACEGDTVHLTLTPDKGYEFYWVYASTASGLTADMTIDYRTLTASFPMLGQDVILTIKCLPKVYYITYDPNAADASGVMRMDSFIYGRQTELLANAFTRPGYEFAGWNTAPDGSGTSYADGETAALDVDNSPYVTLWAQWTPVPYPIVRIGDDNGSASVPTGAVAGETVTVTFTPNEHYYTAEPSVFCGVTEILTTCVDQNTYTFTMPAGGVTVEAHFAPRLYTVYFINNSYNRIYTLQTLNVPYGTIPVYRGETPDYGYSTPAYEFVFAGWDREIVPVTGSAVYTTVYVRTDAVYTVSFLNDDGTTLQTEDLVYGTTPVYNGQTPVKNDGEHTYVFAGWDKEIVPAAENVSYTAVYVQTDRSYTVTFEDGRGNILQTSEVPYGETPVYTGETPDRAPDRYYYYDFTGFSPALAPVTGDTVYTAEYDETPILYEGSTMITMTYFVEDTYFFIPDEDSVYRFTSGGGLADPAVFIYDGDDLVAMDDDGDVGQHFNCPAVLEEGKLYTVKILSFTTGNAFVNIAKEPQYAVTADENIAHGEIFCEGEAYRGKWVEVYSEAEYGYALTSLVVTAENGEEVETTLEGFVMPACPVTVSAVFGEMHTVDVGVTGVEMWELSPRFYANGEFSRIEEEEILYAANGASIEIDLWGDETHVFDVTVTDAAGTPVAYTIDLEYDVWVIRFTMPDGSVTVSLDYVELGDVNRDGVVNIADVTTALNVLSGAEVNTHCDLNGDGVLNITDVTTLLNDLSGGSA